MHETSCVCACVHIYFWYLTAPRRFEMLLMRVFVSRSKAVILLPNSDKLLRYFINEALSLDPELDPAAAPPPSLSSICDLWLLAPPPDLNDVGKTELVPLQLLLLLLSTFFHGNDDFVWVWLVLFVKCVDDSFDEILFRFWAFCLLVFN